MPTTSRHMKLDSTSARKKLKPRHSPYWHLISAGLSLGYRRSRGSKFGSWFCKYTPHDGGRRVQSRLGAADDTMPSDGLRTLDFDTAVDRATKWQPVALQAAMGEAPLRRGAFTVAMALDEYIEHLQRKGSRWAHNAKLTANRYIRPEMGDVRVDLLTKRRIEKWHADIAAKHKATIKDKERLKLPLTPEEQRARKDTANRVLTVLKAALNLAQDSGRVAATGQAWRVRPFAGVARSRVRALSTDEQRELVRWCDPDFRKMVQAALYSGCRYGELCRLRVSDYDPATATIFVAESKSGRSRHVHLEPEAVEFFRSLCARRRSDEHLLLQSDGQPWSKDSQKKPMARAWERVRAEAEKVASKNGQGVEITPCGFHGLRHTCASRWLAARVPMEIVSRQLGHASIRITEQHYAHFRPDYLAETLRTVPRLGLVEAAEKAPAGVLEFSNKRRLAMGTS